MMICHACILDVAGSVQCLGETDPQCARAFRRALTPRAETPETSGKWLCGSCGNQSWGKATACFSCGTPRDANRRSI